jgi:PKD domain/Bacterial Ig-like domain (group 1)
MPPDAPASPTGPEVGRRSVAVGSYRLEVGDPAGIKIKAAAGGKDPRGLAQAIGEAEAQIAAAQAAAEHAASQHEPSPTGLESLEHATEGASQGTNAIELAHNLFEAIIHGNPEIGVIDSTIEALLGALKRLELGEHWDEALKLARELARLLALLQRWVELWESLQTALTGAKRLKDVAGKAWALHEQGTLQLAAENHASADDLLSEARKLRGAIPGRPGLRVTENNLQVLCETLRAKLHKPRAPTPDPRPRLPRGPLPIAACAMLLLIAGGAAGAALRGGSKDLRVTNARVLRVEIEIAPASPRAGEPVTFRAAVEHGAYPAHYAWQFGDGTHADSLNPTHAYTSPGTYNSSVSVSVGRGGAGGSAARRIVVAGAKAGETTRESIAPKRIELTAAPNPVGGGAATSRITATTLNTYGEPISGQPVRFIVKPADGTFSPSSQSTDAKGRAQTSLTLTSERRSAVGDIVEACASNVCNTVHIQWDPQTTPTAATRAASEIDSTTASLNGTLNPNGVTLTTCDFEYGAGAGYDRSASCLSFNARGTSPQDVSTKTSGLIADTTYHFRLVVNSAGGPSYGEPESFTTSEGPPPPAPTVITGSAAETTASATSLRGSVDPNGVNVEDCEFQYGTTDSYGSQTPCSELPGDGTHEVEVSAQLSGLAPAQHYYYRLVATSTGGPGDGASQSFTTLEAPQGTTSATTASPATTTGAAKLSPVKSEDEAPQKPTVETGKPSEFTASGATLNGSVNPHGTKVTECRFEYENAAEYKETGKYKSGTECETPPGAGTGTVAVTAKLSGLPKGLYDYRLIAESAGGAAQGANELVEF